MEKKNKEILEKLEEALAKVEIPEAKKYDECDEVFIRLNSLTSLCTACKYINEYIEVFDDNNMDISEACFLYALTTDLDELYQYLVKEGYIIELPDNENYDEILFSPKALASSIADKEILIGDISLKEIVDSVDNYMKSLVIYKSNMRKIYNFFRDFYYKFSESTESVDGIMEEYVYSEYRNYENSRKYDIESRLINELYGKGGVEPIITSLAQKPTDKDWAELLKRRLNDDIDGYSHDINELDDVRFCLDLFSIFSPRVWHTDYSKEHLDSVIRRIYEINFLKKKINPNIEDPNLKDENEQQDAAPLILPDSITLSIRNDQNMSRKFADIVKAISPKVGGKSDKLKWSHVKKVWEDNGIVPVIGDTDFGRLVHAVDETVDAEKCRQSVKNNAIGTRAEKGKPYWEWDELSSDRNICMDIEKKFREVVDFLRNLKDQKDQQQTNKDNGQRTTQK